MDSPNDIINWGHEIVGHVFDVNGNIFDRVALLGPLFRVVYVRYV